MKRNAEELRGVVIFERMAGFCYFRKLLSSKGESDNANGTRIGRHEQVQQTETSIK